MIVNFGSEVLQIWDCVIATLHTSYGGDKFANPEILGGQICEPHVGIVIKSSHQLKGSQICHPVARIPGVHAILNIYTRKPARAWSPNNVLKA